MGKRRGRNRELDEAPLPKSPAETGPPMRVYLKQFDFDARGFTQKSEGIRVQGHSAVCRARMEELLR